MPLPAAHAPGCVSTDARAARHSPPLRDTSRTRHRRARGYWERSGVMNAYRAAAPSQRMRWLLLRCRAPAGPRQVHASAETPRPPAPSRVAGSPSASRVDHAGLDTPSSPVSCPTSPVVSPLRESFMAGPEPTAPLAPGTLSSPAVAELVPSPVKGHPNVPSSGHRKFPTRIRLSLPFPPVARPTL